MKNMLMLVRSKYAGSRTVDAVDNNASLLAILTETSHGGSTK